MNSNFPSSVTEPTSDSTPSLRRRLRTLHWFWLVPALIVLPAICILMCGGLVAYGPIRLKLSRPYRIASERVRYDDTVIQALGEPVEEASWLPDGQITTEEGRTEASFDFDVAGPYGQANVYAIVEKQGEMWVIKRIEVMLPGGRRQELEL